MAAATAPEIDVSRQTAQEEDSRRDRDVPTPLRDRSLGRVSGTRRSLGSISQSSTPAPVFEGEVEEPEKTTEPVQCEEAAEPEENNIPEGHDAEHKMQMTPPQCAAASSSSSSSSSQHQQASSSQAAGSEEGAQRLCKAAPSSSDSPQESQGESQPEMEPAAGDAPGDPGTQQAAAAPGNDGDAARGSPGSRRTSPGARSTGSNSSGAIPIDENGQQQRQDPFTTLNLTEWLLSLIIGEAAVVAARSSTRACPCAAVFGQRKLHRPLPANHPAIDRDGNPFPIIWVRVKFEEGNDEALYFSKKITIPARYWRAPVKNVIEMFIDAYHGKNCWANLNPNQWKLRVLGGNYVESSALICDELEDRMELRLLPIPNPNRLNDRVTIEVPTSPPREEQEEAHEGQEAQPDAAQVAVPKCKNYGCMRPMDPSGEPRECCHHRQAPEMHGAWRVWPCCQQRAGTWEDLLQIRGCTTSVCTTVASEPVRRRSLGGIGDGNDLAGDFAPIRLFPEDGPMDARHRLEQVRQGLDALGADSAQFQQEWWRLASQGHTPEEIGEVFRSRFTCVLNDFAAGED